MRVPLAVLRIEKFDQDGMLAQRSKRQRRNELFGQRGHQHPHLGPRFDEQSDEYRSLIGCDTSCHSDNYSFSCKHGRQVLCG